MKKVLSLILVLVMMMSLYACGDNANNESNEESIVEDVYPLTITDGEDREVTIESEPMTVITMAPSMTEVLYVLGLGDRLIGRTDYCNYPEAALEAESIGSLREPNVEALIALNPDIILMSTHASEEVAALLEDAGITVAVLAAQESFDGVYEIIRQAGEIFNVQDKAESVVEAMQADVAEVVEAVKDAEKKSVYYVVGYGEWGEYTATGDTFIHELLEMAGGNNIASDGEGWSYNLESIIEKDPEFMICSELGATKDDLTTIDGYKDLTAVLEGRLVTINQDLLSRQGPRMAQGLKAVAQILHPELFQD